VDTYRTQDFADDPPTPHISVHSPPNAHHDHSIACTPPGSLPWLSGGNLLSLELLFDASGRRLVGSLTSLGEEDTEGDEIHLFDVIVPVGDGRDWYVGLTGACGGLWQHVSTSMWNRKCC
jgi:peptide-N4-(N-acetyl-beta-glucosaminyl)asparagine amidase